MGFPADRGDRGRPVGVVQLGLGPIGQAIVRHLTGLPAVRLVGAVDPDPGKVGQDAGQLAGVGALGVVVDAAFDPARHGQAAVAVHAATSSAEAAVEQLLPVVEAGLQVISTCEQLAWPWRHHPSEAHRLDQAARANGVTVLATGVNPGFVMDLLPLVLSGVCTRVDRVVGRRVVDASRRRAPLQRKIGCGLSVDRFRALAEQGLIGHVGLPESAAWVASALGWQLDDLEERIEPVVAREPVATEHVSVDAGCVQGVYQVVEGRQGRRLCIRLELAMVLRPQDAPAGALPEGLGIPSGSYDYLRLEGEPGLEVLLPGGVFGDTATVAAVVNGIPRVLEAPPGLLSATDLPPCVWWAGATLGARGGR